MTTTIRPVPSFRLYILDSLLLHLRGYVWDFGCVWRLIFAIIWEMGWGIGLQGRHICPRILFDFLGVWMANVGGIGGGIGRDCRSGMVFPRLNGRDAGIPWHDLPLG
eukprot:474229-Amorphochlora_amoeboformis.AAC.1